MALAPLSQTNMQTHIKFATLRGSAPIHPADATPAPARPHPDERMYVTVVVRSHASDKEIAAEVRKISGLLPRERPRLSYGEFEQRFGATPEDLKQVTSFFRRQGLRVREISRARRAVVLSGTRANISRAFDVDFVDYNTPQGKYCSHDGAAKIPRHFEGIIEGVLGLDHRPLFNRQMAVALRPAERLTDPLDVAKVYNFPTGTDGRGQTIAILCLGGGFHRSDVRAYFARRRLKMPRLTVVELPGGKNQPAGQAALAAFARKLESGACSNERPDEQDKMVMWTIEATMDVELAGSFAPGAHLVVYFAPNTGRGQYEAFTRALADKVHQPAVHSCSWGTPETTVPLQVQRLMDKAFQLAALKGVTVCAASGDCGPAPVNFPASSPHVLGCGGTHLHDESEAVREVVWNETLGCVTMASSGGFSTTFARPDWQPPSLAKQHAAKPGRGVPDVAAKADLMTGYEIVAGKHLIPMGGTSAAAPLWAGLIARLNQKLGVPVGFLTPLLYSRGFEQHARDIIDGNNGRYKALPGWDACTGVGAPDGERLLAALAGKAQAALNRKRARSRA
ncbi:MAG TPA: S53 family peptidase [Candidatus Acidoferrales bacterium]|nr:S53 family peptidase [Candidatus Acidoferrales bacterium]